MKYICFLLCTTINLSATVVFAQKNNLKDLEQRIDVLEKENVKLKANINEMRQQILSLHRIIQKGEFKYNESNQSSSEKGPELTFEEKSFDFGKVKEGDVVKHTFKFKNTGIEPLKITNVKGSCGCAAAKWPKESIAPGSNGELEVSFHTIGKTGNQHKSLTITSNANPTQHRLYIKAIVE